MPAFHGDFGRHPARGACRDWKAHGAVDDYETLWLRSVDAWRVAARELNVRVTAPFTFTAAQATHECIAQLPDHGGPHGMLVFGMRPGEVDPGGALWREAEACGYYVSFINVEVYAKFDAEVFREALDDWGCHGRQ
jgi:hypothetical protein